MSWLLGLPLLILIYSLTNTYVDLYAVSTFESTTYSGGEGKWLNNKILTFISPIVVFVNATLISKIFNSHYFFEKPTYITGLLYVILASFFEGFFLTNNVFITHTLIILSLSQFLSLRQGEMSNSKVFNGTFLFGVACCLYPPFLFCIPFIYLMIRVFQPFSLRDFLLFISGLSVPFIYLLSFSYVQNRKVEFDFYINSNQNLLDNNILIFFIVLLLFVVASLYAMLTKETKISIKLRKLFFILFYWILIGLGIGVAELIINNSYSVFSICMIPISFILTYSFVSKRIAHITSVLFYGLLFFSFVTFFI